MKKITRKEKETIIKATVSNKRELGPNVEIQMKDDVESNEPDVQKRDRELQSALAQQKEVGGVPFSVFDPLQRCDGLLENWQHVLQRYCVLQHRQKHCRHNPSDPRNKKKKIFLKK